MIAEQMIMVGHLLENLPDLSWAIISQWKLIHFTVLNSYVEHHREKILKMMGKM